MRRGVLGAATVLVLAACSAGGTEGGGTTSPPPPQLTEPATTTAAPTTVVTTTTTTVPGPCGDTAAWTDRQRLAQLVLVGLDGSAVDDARLALLGAEPAAGIFALGVGDLLFRDGYLAGLRAEAAVAPLVAVDEEGGQVQRLEQLVGPLPSAARQTATMTAAQVEALAAEHGRAMKALGVDADLAPVVDLAAATDGGVIGDRSYGTDPEVVTAYAGAFARGLRQAGLLPTLKHFPGHGRATGDSHEEITTAPPLAELEPLDLEPYRQLLAAGPVAVMVGHLDVDGLTEPGVPASLSPATYTLLREGLGFDGLVMTDELGGMAAVSARFDAPEAVVRAIAAGADLALVTGVGFLPAVVDGLAAAVAAGRLPEARVADALDRVLAAKGC